MTAVDRKLRAFVALHPSTQVIERLKRLVETLREKLGTDGIRWARTEQLHLTLEFVGSIPVSAVPAFTEAIARVVSKHSHLHLRAEAIGCFPNVQRARVLWVGLSGEVEKLQSLKADLDSALSPLGYQAETRPFHPHITLARISELNGKTRTALKQVVSDCATFQAEEFRVEQIELMQSHLSPKGAIYEVLASAHLKSF